MAGEFKLAEAFVELKERGALKVRRELGLLKKATDVAARSFGMLQRAVRSLFSLRGLVATGGIAYGIRGLLRLGSTAEETASKFKFVMGEQAKSAEQFVAQMSAAFGRSETDLREYVSTFQAILTGLDFAPDQARQLSQMLTQLALDFASLQNVTDAEALEAFRAGITGETEPLMRRGINVKQAAIDQKLLALGFKDGAAKASEQQKVVARLFAIYDAMAKSNVIGDLQRTSWSFANTMKMMWSALKRLGEIIAQTIMPLFRSLGLLITAIAQRMGDFIQVMLPRITAAMQQLQDTFQGMAALIKNAGNFKFLSVMQTVGKDLMRILGAVFDALGELLFHYAVRAGKAFAVGMVTALKGATLDLPKLLGQGVFDLKLGAGAKEPGFMDVASKAFGPVGTLLRELNAKYAGAAGKAGDWVVPGGPKMEGMDAIQGLFNSLRGGAAEGGAKSQAGGMHTFAGLWEEMQQRQLTKDGEEITKNQEQQTKLAAEMLQAIKAQGAKRETVAAVFQ